MKNFLRILVMICLATLYANRSLVPFSRYLDLQFDRPSYDQSNTNVVDNKTTWNYVNNTTWNYPSFVQKLNNNVSSSKLSSDNNNVDNTTYTNHQTTTGNDDNIKKQQSNHDKHDVTLMIGLSGEFGNHLDKMIRGWGIAQLAKDEYNITSTYNTETTNLQRYYTSNVKIKFITTISSTVLPTFEK